MFVNAVLLYSNGAKALALSSSRYYDSDDIIGECVGDVLRKAHAAGIDVTNKAILAAHEVQLSFSENPAFK